jgi:hypothetical protein
VQTLLKPDGKLIITTPNKYTSRDDVIWDTDLPPIHFWWLSEESIRKIGEKLKFRVELVDFTPFNEKYGTGFWGKQKNSNLHHPVFDEDGNILPNPQVVKYSGIKNVMETFGMVSFIKVVRERAKRLMHNTFPHYLDKQRSYTLCAVLTRE